MTVVEGAVAPELRRFEYFTSGTEGAVGAIRRRFFHWLDGRAFPAVVREGLLELVTAVASEIVAHGTTGLTVTAEDAGPNVFLRLAVHGSPDDGDTVCLGRGLAAVDRMSDVLTVAVVPVIGDRHLLLDVSLPSS